MIGGIYLGVFTPTEGAAATAGLSWAVGGMRLDGFKRAPLGTAKISGMIFLIAPMTELFKGIVPFFISDLVRIAIIIGFPATTTWLAGVA